MLQTTGGSGDQAAMLEHLVHQLQPEAAPQPLSLRLTVNDRPVEAEVEPRTILLDFLRDRLGLTGAKRSCDLQVCGACTVLVDGTPVSSCCTLAYEANGKAVETIEGLARYGELHPIQEAFVRSAALQCGFCTPGMILASKALLAENPHPSREEIKAYLSGNLCRCTGYWNIIEAVEMAARLMAGEKTE
ncbi:MAG TPA: (2Fe-2S)-binding protein [Thermomicrobiales bacterium]